ncbi:hypothetical protein GUJ93_ZPchr0002g23975 [Zizania palustris]|uniref:Uncharacterized protein n=1 Tax=Zizania palustris TaxID=103762 RepID=A0A8J5VE29_ZIZPA|nr:hypothetical protein GUJ93_ZPchr0002g23975 [Zizania palustris]
MEDRVMEVMTALMAKVEGMEAGQQQLAAQMEHVQTKVDLTMASLGRVQQDQEVLTVALKHATTTGTISPEISGTTPNDPSSSGGVPADTLGVDRGAPEDSG